MSKNKHDVAVVHLVWVPLGPELVRAFLQAYSANDTGLPHQLIVVYNGYRTEAELQPFRALLTDYEHVPLLVASPQQDIASYIVAAQTFDYTYFAFLNSYSCPLASDWLSKMHDHMCRSDVGLVGATGSWESAYTNLRAQTTLRGFSKERVRRRFERLSWRRMFDPFPNPHVRSNGFMIARNTLLALRCAPVVDKMDALRFESGKNSMTNQVRRMSLQTLLIGRDGVGYEPREWPSSGTFRQANQRNLLIADNRTEQYSAADPQTRALWESYSWGSKLQREGGS